MKIDRHNYEEFFLLYVDNELNVEQKKQVELFAQENPDLEEELVMLQQSRLIPDEAIVFDKKELLMKEENHSFINMNNYEEWLVLYLDNELNEEERREVEKFTSEHTHVQEELALFQQTKLQPEEIVFPHKAFLYKKEERVRVISMSWWRVAAAAVLIIATGITIYSVLNKGQKTTTGKEEIALNKKSQKNNNTIDTVKPVTNEQPQIKNIPAPPNEQPMEEVTVIAPVQNTKKTKQVTQQQDKNLVKQQNNHLPVSENQRTFAVTDDPEKRPALSNEINTTTITKPQIKNEVAISDKSHKQIFNDQPVTIADPGTPDPVYARNTENKKLRGFFRKATRFIERTTNINPANDDNKVLIGGMAINLK